MKIDTILLFNETFLLTRRAPLLYICFYYFMLMEHTSCGWNAHVFLLAA